MEQETPSPVHVNKPSRPPSSPPGWHGSSPYNCPVSISYSGRNKWQQKGVWRYKQTCQLPFPRWLRHAGLQAEQTLSGTKVLFDRLPLLTCPPLAGFVTCAK